MVYILALRFACFGCASKAIAVISDPEGGIFISLTLDFYYYFFTSKIESSFFVPICCRDTSKNVGERETPWKHET